MSGPAAPGSFDCVAARFASSNFAQDDNSGEQIDMFRGLLSVTDEHQDL